MSADKKNHNDDEIDILEFIEIVWKRKFFICAFLALVSVCVVIYTLTLDNIYASRAVLKPTDSHSAASSSLGGLGSLVGLTGINIGSGGSVFADMTVLLKDKRFIAEFIKKNNFAPKLAKNPDALNTPSFKENETFNLYSMVNTRITLNEDRLTNYITVSFEDKDPAFAKEFVTAFLVEISGILKQKQLENVDKRIENYKLEIDRAADMTLKIKLSELVANLIQSKVLANADEYYGFSVISEPSMPDLKDRIYPKRAKICIIVFFGGFVAAVFGVLIHKFSIDAINRRKDYLARKNGK